MGNKGNIAYYNGNNWRKIESRTELDIYDIWGDYNEATGEYEILAVAGKLLHSSDRDIIKITENQATILNENGIDWSLHGIWFKSNRKYFVVGSGIYKKNKLTEENWDTSLDLLTDYYTHSIRGTKLNDIIISGAYNEVLHYNGYSWQSYRGMINSSETGRLVKLDYKNNKCCIVGSNDGRAIIYVGKN